MTNKYETLGYVFGRTLTAENIDPVFYAREILEGLNFSREDEQAVCAGAQKAVNEMQPQMLMNNLKHLSDILLMDNAKQADANVDGFEIDIFKEGLRSVVNAYLPTPWTGKGTPEFERGRAVGERIMAAWNTAIVQSEADLFEVVTAAEAAEQFDLTESAVRQAIGRNQITARKSAGTWLVLRTDAQARWGKPNGGSTSVNP